LIEEITTTSNKKPLINDIFGQSEVKDTFVAILVSTKESNATTENVKKSLTNTGISTASTAFLGLASLLAAFILRIKFNK
jgi:LPXTG-motif cell wall anchor domain protein